MPEVNFLPWTITAPTTIGPVTIAPWSTVRTTVPGNARTFLDRYFRRYRTNSNHAVGDVTIASITQNPLQQLSDAQRTTVRRAIDALAFTSIAPGERTSISGNHASIPNSERFQLTTQLTTYSPQIAVRTRGMTHLWTMTQIHFCTPWEAGSDQYETDDEVLNALGKLLGSTRNVRLRERIFTAIEWFRLSNTGSPQTSDETRVIMKAAAFEALLEPGGQQRVRMTRDLTTLTNTGTIKQRTITINKKKHHVNAIASWLNQFYKLRNKIVHGDTIKPGAFRY